MAKYRKILSEKIKMSDSIDLSQISPAGSAYKQVSEELRDGTLAASNYNNRLIEVMAEKANEQVEIARIRFWIGLFVGALIALLGSVFVTASFKWIEPNIYQDQYLQISVGSFIILIIFGLYIYCKLKKK